MDTATTHPRAHVPFGRAPHHVVAVVELLDDPALKTKLK